MYGKVFERIYDSTVADDWQAMVTFQQLIVLADKDGMVFHSPKSLAKRTGIPLDIIAPGIEILLMPDPASQSQEAGGRRIIPLPPEENGRKPHGWIVVNYHYFTKLCSEEDRKVYMRRYMRDYRAKDKEKEPPPDKIPDIEEILNASKDKLEEGLELICLELKTKEIFPKSFTFKNQGLKQKKNKRAILHTLKQCMLNHPKEPWPYCKKVLEVEDGNYNEREHRGASPRSR